MSLKFILTMSSIPATCILDFFISGIGFRENGEWKYCTMRIFIFYTIKIIKNVVTVMILKKNIMAYRTQWFNSQSIKALQNPYPESNQANSWNWQFLFIIHSNIVCQSVPSFPGDLFVIVTKNILNIFSLLKKYCI